MVVEDPPAEASAPKENGVGADAGAPEQSAPAPGEELAAEDLLEDTERVYAPYEVKAILFKNVPGSMKSADLEKVRTVACSFAELLYSTRMYHLAMRTQYSHTQVSRIQLTVLSN